MAELEYGFTEGPRSLISLRAGLSLLERSLERESGLGTALRKAKHSGTVEIEDEGDIARLNFDFKRAWRKKDISNKWSALRAAEDVLITLANCSVDQEYKENLVVRFGTVPVADGRLSMYAVIRWPEVVPNTVAELATERMREVASDLRYGAPELQPSRRTSMVYAQANREYGVVLQTNPMGSCSLDTDGMQYEPSDDFFEVFAHNIYNREQQIICLAGAIAIAQADELAKL